MAATQRLFTFTTVEVPGARSTGAQGIDSHGNVVGIYVDAGGWTRGFLLTRESGAFTLLAPHDYAAPGTYTVRVTVTDRHGATGTAGMTLVVTP